jgi:hypothetical protein
MEEEPPYIETVDQDPADFSVFGPMSLFAAVNPSIAKRDLVTSLKLTALVNVSRLSFRDIFEELIAKNQCKYVLRDKPRDESAVCWLCGYSIGTLGYELRNRGKRSWTNARPDSSAANAPECEHLLPAAAAAMYFGIVGSAEEAKDAGGIEYFSLNYEWGHRICNGIKDHSLFMDIRNPDGSYRLDVTINDRYISAYLWKLYNASPEIQSLNQNTFDKFHELQLGRIRERLIPLQDSIRSQPRMNILLGTTTIFENIDRLYDKFLERLRDPRPVYRDQQLTNIELLEQMNNQLQLYIDYPPRGRGGRKRTLSRKGGRRNNKT